MDGVLGVDEILFFVPDVQEAKSWYAELLGTTPYFDHKRYCAFRLSGIAIGLHPSDEKNSTGTAGQVTYWRVLDIHKTIAEFERHGCTKFRGPTFGVDEVWVCQMMDPFGNVWGLVEKPAAP